MPPLQEMGMCHFCEKLDFDNIHSSCPRVSSSPRQSLYLTASETQPRGWWIYWWIISLIISLWNSPSPIPKSQLPHPGELQTDRWMPSSRGTLGFNVQQETFFRNKSRWICFLDPQAEIDVIRCLLTTSIFILISFFCRN